MNESLLRFLTFLTDPVLWFFTFVTAAVVFLLIVGYRQLKLKALETTMYTRSFSTDGIFVGESLELTETIRNPGWLPLFAVKMEFCVPSGLTVGDTVCKEYTKLTSVFNIPPFATVQRRHVIRADKRGRYTMQNAFISYLGCDFVFETPIEFFAYPDVFNTSAKLDPALCRAGNALANRKYIEDPFFLAGIREYRPGDPMRSVNFKASVRSFSGGMYKLMCNEYDSSRTHDSMIFLDLNTYADSDIDNKEQLEVGLRYACFLFCRALENGGRVGFCTNCTVGTAKYIYTPCGSGEQHSKRILEQFAELDIYARRDFSMPAILEKYAFASPLEVDIYLIASAVDSKMSELLYRLERTGHNVQVVPLVGGAHT